MAHYKNKIVNIFLSCFVILLLTVISANAASLTVSNTADAGVGSLRQAIIDATVNVEANIVTFNIPTSDPGFSAANNRFTINLLSPLPNIPLAPMTINNNQAQFITVRGSNSFRIFTLVNSAVVTMTNLTISHGSADNGLGGAILMGDSGTLTLSGSTVSNNSATGNGGGIYMSNSGTLTLTNSTVRNNSAVNGGGVYMFDSSTVNITASTINGNTAGAGGSGGGIYNGTSGTVNAANSTFDGNTAGSNGGAIYNTATATLTSNTITANSAGKGGGIYNTFVGTLNNNLIALNTATDGNDLVGRASLGQAYNGNYNLIGNADGSEGLGPTTNQLGSTASPIDPLIGILKDNGGPTLTRAVHTRSPAIDKGNSPDLAMDQRGRARPYDNILIPNAPGGDGSDIGAFERTFSPTPFDYDADGRADISVFRPSIGTWYINQSTEGLYGIQFGQAGDKIVPTDYDGDGKTDIAVVRDIGGQLYWFVLGSSAGTVTIHRFGSTGDIAAPADYDGDGEADVTVFRPSSGIWYRINSSNGAFNAVQFGTNGDKPTIGDFDGDGKADIAVYRPSSGVWYQLRSSNGAFVAEQFGASTDRTVQADYDHDGKTDIAVFRPSTGVWYIKNSSTSSFSINKFGVASDVTAPADFDGDGKADLSVFRPSESTWYRQNSSNSAYMAIRFGSNGDTATPSAFIY